MSRVRHLALVFAAACSPVHDASNVPDASIDAMDMRPPMIESSVPANMATKVSVLQPISVFFDERLDPDSVTATTVKLGYDQSQPPLIFARYPAPPDVEMPQGPVPAGLTWLPGTVSYDAAARKISFVPAAPLPYGARVTLVMDVKDTGGVAFTGKVTFITYVNANILQTSYNASTGAITSWFGQPTDMNGWIAKRIAGNLAGNDQTWFTSDDPRTQHVEFGVGADGRILDERVYNNGNDTKYDTPDDQVTVCTKYSYNAQGLLADRVYSGANGADLMWCTGDDIPFLRYVYEYTDSVRTGWVIDTGPGQDMVWRTPDDLCAVYWDFTYDAQGNKTREVYHQCGNDGMRRTNDDTFIQYYDYEYDANGNLTKLIFTDGPGNDGMWLMGEDQIARVERYIRNSDGLVTDVIVTTAPGADMMWGTPDDTPGTRTRNVYNAKKLVEEITTYSAFGGDMMWGTDDDVISGYSKLTYAEDGNRTDQKFYAAGIDGMWKTPDDRVSADYDFDLTK